MAHAITRPGSQLPNWERRSCARSSALMVTSGARGYIASWIDLLNADKPPFFTARSHASEAADHLRDLALVICRAISSAVPAPWGCRRQTRRVDRGSY